MNFAVMSACKKQRTGSDDMTPQEQKSLFSMRDLPVDVLWMIVALAMQNCRGEMDCQFLRQAKDWLKIINARRDGCYSDQRYHNRKISELNDKCQPDVWARVLHVPSIPSDILSCPDTLEACRHWFMKIASRMLQEVLCQYNTGVIYKRLWKAPPSWDELALRREYPNLSPDAQSNWIEMVAERQAGFFLAILLYQNGVLGPRVLEFNALLHSCLNDPETWGLYLSSAPWWLEHQRDCATHHDAAIEKALKRVTVAFKSQQSVASGEFLFDFLQGKVPRAEADFKFAENENLIPS